VSAVIKIANAVASTVANQIIESSLTAAAAAFYALELPNRAGEP